MIIILYVLYPNLIQRIAQMFQCRHFDWGDGVERSFLITDYRIDCSSPEYSSNQSVAFVFTLLYGIGIPLGCMGCVKVCLPFDRLCVTPISVCFGCGSGPLPDGFPTRSNGQTTLGLGAGMHQKGKDRRGGARGGWTGGWRRLPKRLGAVTVGYQCH